MVFMAHEDKTQWLFLRGVRTHNLQNIDLDIPKYQLTVITGVSGSGKSSLAFDTLYAEGQRRYVESLSTYARQFLQMMEKPDVDLIEGLSPAIAIEQKVVHHNPRSTVGTVTEIYDYLRLLFARVGQAYCPEHHLPLAAQTITQMLDHVMALPKGTKVAVVAPIARQKKGDLSSWFLYWQSKGFVRFRINGDWWESSECPPFNSKEKHDFAVVVDRLKIDEDRRVRLSESIETALSMAEGKVLIVNMDSGHETLLSARFACPVCDASIAALEPRLFSFNSPIGACTSCDGLGVKEAFDPERIVAFPDLSLAGGAIEGWDRRNAHYYALIKALADHYAFDIDTPFEALPAHVKQVILYGSGDEKIHFTYDLKKKSKASLSSHVFEGVIANFERRYQETDNPAVREELGRYRAIKPCPDCHGARLNQAALHVKIGSTDQALLNIDDIGKMNLAEALLWFQSLCLEGTRAHIAEKIVAEIVSRLYFLNNVGLSYLSLSRHADTLSGGESQRIRLASQIGSGLSGVIYVLDEPSIGLHQRDNDRLIQTLKRLRDMGNTVLVVEHDEDMIREADHVIDMGPGAGVHGGRVMACGHASSLMLNADSLTGQFLSGKRGIEIPSQRRAVDQSRMIHIEKACGHNLQSIDVLIPIGLLTCVTGVSGSGKSTLINDTLYAWAAHEIHRSHAKPAPCADIKGLEAFDKVINVDQSPIGRTPRSNPATYMGIFTLIRELMADTPKARESAYGPGRFSFNVAGGRCEACQGDGVMKVEMHFLPDVYVTCDVCHGLRYNPETLAITYKGVNVAQILDMTVDEAYAFFKAIPAIERKLKTLMDVGLSYLRLGQNSTTLSGGEAQRIKLALELSKKDTGKTLYILDEPTTGLHFADIELLLKVLHRLCDQGNTLVVIEHNLDVIKTADWLIDMGPEGGENGGQVVASGTPESICKNKSSLTGRYLAAAFKRKRVA